MNSINFKLYWKVIQFNLSKFTIYPTEFIAYLLSRFIELFLLGIFWYAVSLANPSINFKLMLSYFLIVDGFKSIMFSFENRLSKYFQEIIQNGDFSNYLMKPLKIIPYVICSFIGEHWINFLYSFIVIILGLILMPAYSFASILFCIPFIILGTVIAININILIACMTFYSPDADGVRNAINHMLRIASGALVPIYMFPDVLKNILLLSPFPALAYLPVYVLQTPLALNIILYHLVVTLSWSIILTFITNKIWVKSLKDYESVGM